jgi:nucleoside-diphosphate-sugar epimerase
MDLAGRTVVVTGGAGLIGSHLVERLLAARAKVIAADDFSRGRQENLAAVRDRIEIRQGDLEDPAAMERALAGVDIVFHLASRAFGIAYSERNHLKILQHNERITNNLIEMLVRRPVAHLLVTSSSCVYPDDGPDTVPELPLYTGEPETANWGYGWAKRLLEQKSHLLARETGVPLTIVRPFNIYGERYAWAGEHSQAIPMQIKKVLDGDDPVVIWGSGTQRRNYLHALDCAAVMATLVERGFVGAVNIGTEDTVTLRELVEKICQLGGRQPRLVVDRSKPEGRHIKSADATLLRTIWPDFRPQVTLDDGLRRMLGWYEATFATGRPQA